jgi:hypothetical protein
MIINPMINLRLISFDDLDNDLYSIDPISDFSTCIRPDSIRPYKAPSAI